MIPAGRIKARAVSMLLISSTNKHTPGVTVTFNITEDGPHKGQLREWTGWLTPDTEAKTSEQLVLCGYDGVDPNSIRANEVVLVIEHETYIPLDKATGQPRRNDDGTPKSVITERVRWINDPARAGASFPAMDDAKKVSAQERLKGLVLAQRAQKAKQAVAPAQQQAASAFDFGMNALAPAAPAAAPPAAPAGPDGKVGF